MKRIVRFGIVCAFLFLNLVGCGRKLSENQLPRPSSQLASYTESFPGVVKIRGKELCTGTLVGPSTILTAAHCLSKGGPFTVETAEGTFQTDSSLSLGTGKEGDENDLALLYLPSPISDRRHIFPLASGVKRGESVTLVGFGCASSDFPSSGGVKRLGTNVVSDINDFIEVSTPGIQIRMIAGPENRAGVCFGDSGGPLLKQVGDQWVVVGVSHGAYNQSHGQVSQFVNFELSPNRNFLSQYVR